MAKAPVVIIKIAPTRVASTLVTNWMDYCIQIKSIKKLLSTSSRFGMMWPRRVQRVNIRKIINKPTVLPIPRKLASTLPKGCWCPWKDIEKDFTKQQLWPRYKLGGKACFWFFDFFFSYMQAVLWSQKKQYLSPCSCP